MAIEDEVKAAVPHPQIMVMAAHLCFHQYRGASKTDSNNLLGIEPPFGPGVEPPQARFSLVLCLAVKGGVCTVWVPADGQAVAMASEGFEWEEEQPAVEDGPAGEAERDDALTLFVSRIPFAWSDEDLALAMAAFGEVSHATISWDTRADRSKGVGFATFTDQGAYDAAMEAGRLKLKKVRHKATGTLKLTKVDRTIGQTRQRPCHMWARGNCQLGDQCAFQHDPSAVSVAAEAPKEPPKPKKCFAFKRGKCDRGDSCPFRHEGPSVNGEEHATEGGAGVTASPPKAKLAGVCHLWKKKGACKNLDKGRCKYLHPEDVAAAAKAKAAKQQRKKQQEVASKVRKAAEAAESARIAATHVKCYGLPYTTTEEDVRKHFASCGKIVSMDMPLWPDSGRSKGFCTMEFKTPRGAAAALALPEEQLRLGERWLQLSAGKALRSWESHGREQPENCKSIFVGNLPFDVDEQTLRDTFQRCGKVLAVRLQREKAFAFLDFSNQRGPEDAVALNGNLLGGRAMRIDFAENGSSGGKDVSADGETAAKRTKLDEE